MASSPCRLAWWNAEERDKPDQEEASAPARHRILVTCWQAYREWTWATETPLELHRIFRETVAKHLRERCGCIECEESIRQRFGRLTNKAHSKACTIRKNGQKRPPPCPSASEDGKDNDEEYYFLARQGSGVSTSSQESDAPVRKLARTHSNCKPVASPPFIMKDDPREFLEVNKDIIFSVDKSCEEDEDLYFRFLADSLKYRADIIDRLYKEMVVAGTGPSISNVYVYLSARLLFLSCTTQRTESHSH